MSTEPIQGDARRRLISSMRRRSALAAAVVLAVVWLALYAQLKAGDDPVLG
ncbi:MAG: hypothetical protein QOI98_73, partial [Solirubrobacteraceae bacterium]|nr:hypothetical protein [Solirubrobacteraceae bacterium]